jgi:peroxiredoxin
MPLRCTLLGLAAVASLCLAGCGGTGFGSFGAGSSSDQAGADDIHFRDDATTNVSPGDALANLAFVDESGRTIHPRDFAGKKNLVLVFTRGYNGSICAYCSTYTSSLIANYRTIAQRDAEVLVVYPIAKPDQSRHLSEFLAATFKRSGTDVSKTPFPVVLDIGLKAVDALGIRKDLSKPATYILDQRGQVRFAHVGNTLSDRPTIKVILQQLDALKQESS